jgi:uncharacterized spore protein YtfJ
MDVQEVLSQVRDAVTVKRVYGEPYERNGVVVIPAARVGGGGGGGGGEGEGDQPDKGKGSGFGLGFGLGAAPVGAYVIRGDEVEWKPAIDVTSVILRLQGVLILVLLSLLRARRRS